MVFTSKVTVWDASNIILEQCDFVTPAKVLPVDSSIHVGKMLMESEACILEHW